MSFPLQALLERLPELGLALAVLIGVGFGVALEQAGFGRATKLAAQFYLTDMTVFKVMFSAIVTAMLGLVLASGAGIVELDALGKSAASQTYLWPMAVGGFLLGAGFIIAGYCPGTSVVAAASGNVDGLATVLGVIGGSVAYGFARPLLGGFPESGARGHLFLYSVVHLHPALVAALIALVAIALFIGAERVEQRFTRRAAERRSAALPAPESARVHARAFALLGASAAFALGSMLFPTHARAQQKGVQMLPVSALAARVIEEPWAIRVLDLRAADACAKQRVPGAECVSEADLDKLGLAFAPATRDLVLVDASGSGAVADEARKYRGRIFLLEGGFAAWRAYALTPPAPPSDSASAEARTEYARRSGINKVFTGKAAPPPPAIKGFVAPVKKKSGGCAG